MGDYAYNFFFGLLHIKTGWLIFGGGLIKGIY